MEADLLDTVFKISVSGGGLALAGAAARIGFGWGKLEAKVTLLIDAFQDSLEERTRLVKKNDREHEEARKRIDSLERDVANLKGRQGMNGK